MQSNANRERLGQFPALGLESALEIYGGCGRIGRPLEYDESTVALASRADHDTVFSAGDRFDECIMPPGGRAHRGWLRVPQACAALDVGQDKGDGARR